MTKILDGIIASSAILCLACAPLVSTHSKPRGLNITSECVREGKKTFVQLIAQHPMSNSPWSAEFTDDTPVEVKIDNNPTFTKIRWELDRNRMKKIVIPSYKLKLSNEGQTYSATVAFKTTSEQIIVAFLQALIRIH